jgi:hypothetical protein
MMGAEENAQRCQACLGDRAAQPASSSRLTAKMAQAVPVRKSAEPVMMASSQNSDLPDTLWRTQKRHVLGEGLASGKEARPFTLLASPACRRPGCGDGRRAEGEHWARGSNQPFIRPHSIIAVKGSARSTKDRKIMRYISLLAPDCAMAVTKKIAGGPDA